jgi:hypothetical protein
MQENCKMEIKTAAKAKPETRMNTGFFEGSPSATTRDFESAPL